MGHIPSFVDVAKAVAAVEKLNISKAAKRELQNMIAEASTADRHSTDRRTDETSKRAAAHRKNYVKDSVNFVSQAGALLDEISDDEWDRLVEDANREAE